MRDKHIFDEYDYDNINDDSRNYKTENVKSECVKVIHNIILNYSKKYGSRLYFKYDQK